MSDVVDREEREADLAGEYVLGVLDGASRRAAERRMGRDRAFRAEVSAWQARFAPLLDTVPAVAPPPRLWSRIAADLDRFTRAGAPAPISAMPRSAEVRAGVAPFWRPIAIASSALALAGLAAIAALAPLTLKAPVEGAVYTARIAAENGQTYYTAVVDTGANTLTLVPADVPADADARVPELWLIEGDAAPKSLGVVDRRAALRVPLTQAPPGTAATFAVSLEPAGGSPTGAPTGPVVATGTLEGI